MTIKNGDLPAMPIELSGFGQFAPEAHTGLTKREQFAAMAMQGLISSGMDWTLFDYRDVSEQAVIMADSLLKELERTK